MPRPPRSRHAPTRSARAIHPTTTSKPAPASVTETDVQVDAPIIDNHDVNDNNDEESVAPRRTSSRASTAAAEVPAGGAIRSRTTATESTEQKMMMDRANQRRDAAMERLENITSTTGSDEEDEVVKNTQGSVDAEERAKATPVRPRLTDVSGLDLDDSMFDDLNTTLDTVVHASAQRSAETSTLSASHFRRRPRAGSFLSRDDGPIRPSSRTGTNTPAFSSTLNFGVFKRRAREPSILSTAQKPGPQHPDIERGQEQENNDSNDEDDDEEIEDGNFGPEAESTPLRRSKRGSGRVEPAPESPSTKSRKRKSTENHEQRIRSSPYEVNDNIRQSIEQPQASDDESLLSSPPSLPSNRFSTPARPSMDPELMAPPLSSDSSDSDEELWPPLKSIPKARTRRGVSTLRQTPGFDDGVSDMSSPPSLTHSPNHAASSSPPPARAAKTKRKPVVKPLPKLTTAELTGMLPRRRQRVSQDDPSGLGEDESEAEVDVSGLREGDDELEHLDTRARKRPISRAGPKATTQAPSTKQNTDRPLQGSKKRVSRTYSRLSDKENQGEDENEGNAGPNPAVDDIIEEDSQMLVERIGEELKNAVRKFQEVDKWELSFEEKDRSSSPLNAR
jgi:hypothetical protein